MKRLFLISVMMMATMISGCTGRISRSALIVEKRLPHGTRLVVTKDGFSTIEIMGVTSIIPREQGFSATIVRVACTDEWVLGEVLVKTTKEHYYFIYNDPNHVMYYDSESDMQAAAMHKNIVYKLFDPVEYCEQVK